MASDSMREYVEQLYEQSLKLMESPETINEAIEKLNLILRVDPNNAKANFSLGKTLNLYGRPEEALVYIKKAEELGFSQNDIQDLRREIKNKIVYREAPETQQDDKNIEGTGSKLINKISNIKQLRFENVWSFIRYRDHILDFSVIVMLFIINYFLLKSSLSHGYPRSYLDATMAFYIAKIKMLLQNKSLYTNSWYFGYEMLKYYPPLSTYLPAFFAIITGQLQASYYSICFLSYTAFCVGVYFFVSRFYESKLAGFFAGFLWVFAHVNYISFQGHYWETSRLLGTTALPWVLFFLHKTTIKENKKALVISILLSSYVLLSNLFSAIDLALFVGPYLLINIIRSKLIHGDDNVLRVYRGLTVIVAYAVGVLALTLWWYIPATIPSGLEAYLTGSTGFTPPLYETFLQMFPPSYMPAVQLPITILGIAGVLIGLLKPTRKWFLLLFWFASSYLMAYVVKIQSERVVLLFGLCLVFGSGFLISEIQKKYFEKSPNANRQYLLVALVIISLGIFISQYMTSYMNFSIVDEAYITTDEYIVSTWLSENAGINHRVYLMWGRWFRGSQWINAFYPEVMQVLGGYDQGARAETELPFVFDSLVKWQEDAYGLQEMAKEYNIKYIVIDERFLQTQPSGYNKFSNTDIFQRVDEINNRLKYAAIFEVKDVENIDPLKLELNKEYTYWTNWRIIGIFTSLILLVVFSVIIRRLKLGEIL